MEINKEHYIIIPKQKSCISKIIFTIDDSFPRYIRNYFFNYSSFSCYPTSAKTITLFLNTMHSFVWLWYFPKIKLVLGETQSLTSGAPDRVLPGWSSDSWPGVIGSNADGWVPPWPALEMVTRTLPKVTKCYRLLPNDTEM